MITFKNIAGNKFIAAGTIQRKSALNGEKSLTGTLYDGKDVLNKIDKGWSLEFDGEPYVVTYFERNDNDNSVSFDAIHKFFWDMAKKVLYSSTEISGSHTIKWYLDQIFANTGYTYALNFSPAAIEKDNWGNKTRLSLFNDLITSIAGEFEINGTLISIFQNIGTDLSTIVRYGFNLSDMTLENDATSFVTYGEGFGAYADQENQTGERVHVTYTSPLAGVYGILQAEPIDDQRYTSQANLQAAVKAQVDASFSVSVQLSLYDLTAAGYPYKMANVGDWLTAVDENLDFKQRIRIISIDDEFSADGTRISYTVTAGDIGLTKKYQDAHASMASQVANAIVSAGQASTDANFALIAANGKLTAYYVGSYDELPTTANEGDLGWVTSGDGRLLYIYTKKADGSYYWEKRIDPEMGDQIAAGVTKAVSQAKAHTDEVKQGLSSDIATAKSQAASLANAAEANAKSEAVSQFNRAQSALSAAKTDLTKSIASEASARTQAVAAVNSQAQNYVNQAKSDITDTINAISVGGRNLLLGTANDYVLNPVTDGSWKENYNYWTTYNSLTPGIKYTLSSEVTLSSGKSISVKVFDSSIQQELLADNDFLADGTRQHLTFTAPDNSTALLMCAGQSGTTLGITATFHHTKLEKGTIPTDWTPAPEDVVLDYTTKDNKIKETITQYQDTNDGLVSKAQTDATTALGLVETKVSLTDYNTKTGELSSHINDVKDTADSSAQTIADIQEADGKRDSRMSEIEKTAEGITSTVSDLSTAQGKQSGYISTLQQRADGFDASFSTINNTVNGLGQTNQLMNTEFSPDFEGWVRNDGFGIDKYTKVLNGSNVVSLSTTNEAYDYIWQFVPVKGGTVLSFSTYMHYTPTNPDGSTVFFRYQLVFYDDNNTALSEIFGTANFQSLPWTLQKSENVTVPDTATSVRVAYYTRGAGYVAFSQPMLVFESTVGAYVQGNYNNNDALAQVKLTADKASLDLSTYKIDANGQISKAQADITATAKQVATKVSQTDYDQKTGDLTQAVAKAQTTADGVVTTVGNYQTSNDKRVKAAESAISQNADAIALKVAKTDYDNNNSQLNTRFTKVETTANGTATTVSNLQQTVNSLGQVNQLFNTEFTPDYQSWTGYDTTFVNDVYTKTYKGSNVVAINSKDTGYHYLWQFVPVVAGTVISFSSYMHYNPTSPDNSTVFFRYQLVFYDDSNTSVGQVFGTANLQSLDWVLQKSENIAVPTGATKVRVTFYSRGAGYAAIAQPMLVFASTVGTYVQGNYNNNAALAQVKVTADSLSNFVRDSSGNISSDFQTALSKTSIITGSTLASSIKTQTATQISSAITDNNGKIISLINQDSSGVQIAGENIILDGTVSVLSTFWAKQINAMKVNANNITVGTLNGNQVNITNINANNIVSGAISGANLNINLNTGSVVFQKGRINSSDYTTDINIDQGYISTANGDTRVILKKGQLQLTSPDYYDLQTNPYLSISNDPRTFDSTGKLMYSAVISARDRVVIGNADGINSMLGDSFSFGQSSFYGLSSGKTIGKKIPTVVGGGATGVVLVGGSTYTNTIGANVSPSIIVGWSPGSSTYSGNRVMIEGDRVHIPSIYNRTWSTSSNVYVAADGSLYRAASARKYKLDIKNNIPITDSLKLIEVPLSTWVDKHEHEENGSNERYFGMIAEDLRDAGLEYLVQYGENNEVEGINYDRVALLLIPLVKELKERIEELESEGK